MKQEKILTGICTVLLLLFLVLGLGFWYRYRMMHQVNGIQPYMIMVDGTRYSNFGPVQTDKAEGAPYGVVHRVTDPSDYPSEDGEANFGTVGMPYWKVSLGVCVYENGKYILLRD